MTKESTMKSTNINNHDEDYIALPELPHDWTSPELSDEQTAYINRGYWEYEQPELQTH